MFRIAKLSLVPASSIVAGQPVILSVSLAAANRNPAAIDTARLVVTISSGDQEMINFVESAPNSGTFLAAIESRGIGPAPTSGDCRFSVPLTGHVTIDNILHTQYARNQRLVRLSQSTEQGCR